MAGGAQGGEAASIHASPEAGELPAVSLEVVDVLPGPAAAGAQRVFAEPEGPRLAPPGRVVGRAAAGGGSVQPPPPLLGHGLLVGLAPRLTPWDQPRAPGRGARLHACHGVTLCKDGRKVSRVSAAPPPLTGHPGPKASNRPTGQKLLERKGWWCSMARPPAERGAPPPLALERRADDPRDRAEAGPWAF